MVDVNSLRGNNLNFPLVSFFRLFFRLEAVRFVIFLSDV